MDRSVKFAQQVLNRMVVFPSSPPTLFPPESFRLAVTVRVVTPTETQSPCRQQQTADMQVHLQVSRIYYLFCAFVKRQNISIQIRSRIVISNPALL